MTVIFPRCLSPAIDYLLTLAVDFSILAVMADHHVADIPLPPRFKRQLLRLL